MRVKMRKDFPSNGREWSILLLAIMVSGSSLLVFNSSSLREAFVRITVSNSEFLNVLSDVVGWAYFVAWSVSFYPQIYENWRRKR